nr:hypothetical protein Iba_chr10aCG16920 [Ipomoea batatas]GME10564.1 hypothetical protein Iba_scaffold10248CG0030 [Ipomoea batatas]
MYATNDGSRREKSCRGREGLSVERRTQSESGRRRAGCYSLDSVYISSVIWPENVQVLGLSNSTTHFSQQGQYTKESHRFEKGLSVFVSPLSHLQRLFIEDRPGLSLARRTFDWF